MDDLRSIHDRDARHRCCLRDHVGEVSNGWHGENRPNAGHSRRHDRRAVELGIGALQVADEALDDLGIGPVEHGIGRVLIPREVHEPMPAEAFRRHETRHVDNTREQRIIEQIREVVRTQRFAQHERHARDPEVTLTSEEVALAHLERGHHRCDQRRRNREHDVVGGDQSSAIHGQLDTGNNARDCFDGRDAIDPDPYLELHAELAQMLLERRHDTFVAARHVAESLLGEPGPAGSEQPLCGHRNEGRGCVCIGVAELGPQLWAPEELERAPSRVPAQPLLDRHVLQTIDISHSRCPQDGQPESQPCRERERCEAHQFSRTRYRVLPSGRGDTRARRTPLDLVIEVELAQQRSKRRIAGERHVVEAIPAERSAWHVRRSELPRGDEATEAAVSLEHRDTTSGLRQSQRKGESNHPPADDHEVVGSMTLAHRSRSLGSRTLIRSGSCSGTNARYRSFLGCHSRRQGVTGWI